MRVLETITCLQIVIFSYDIASDQAQTPSCQSSTTVQGMKYKAYTGGESLLSSRLCFWGDAGKKLACCRCKGVTNALDKFLRVQNLCHL